MTSVPVIRMKGLVDSREHDLIPVFIGMDAVNHTALSTGMDWERNQSGGKLDGQHTLWGIAA